MNSAMDRSLGVGLDQATLADFEEESGTRLRGVSPGGVVGNEGNTQKSTKSQHKSTPNHCMNITETIGGHMGRYIVI